VAVPNTAKITYQCRTCEVTAQVQAELEHKEDCANKFGIDRHCAKSGKAPHVSRSRSR